MKIYSFDLWNTLIRSNPEFKNKRDSFLFSFFDNKDGSFSNFQSIVEAVSKGLNKKAEVTGMHVPCVHILYSIFNGYDAKLFTMEEYIFMEKTIQELFLTYPPSLYDEDTLKVLDTLSKRMNHKIDLRSNTGFIHGTTLVKAMELLGIAKYFDEMFFSDQIHYAKPHEKMFSRRRHLNNVEDWIHVGDSKKADGGCEKFGIKFFHFSDERPLIELL